MRICTSLFREFIRSTLLAGYAASVLATHPSIALAAVPYSTPGSSYTQNFDSLPNSPNNASLVGQSKEWQDDTSSPAVGHISIPGWYLWHPLVPDGGEDGFNGHQRLRITTGSSTTGTFYSFGANASTERALGSLVSTTLADNGDSMFMGLRLTNNTGVTLNKFTLQFNGEQWRDQIGTPNVAKVLTFGYRTDATSTEFTYSSVFAANSGLDFTAPVVGATAATVDGNVAGRVSIGPVSISHLNWAPGTDLWVRWADVGVGGSDDAIGIDDVSFSAVAGDVSDQAFISDQSGPASVGTTWNDDQVPVAGNIYFVRSGDTVAIDSAFAGSELRLLSGATVSFDAAGSGAHIPLLTLNSGSSIVETVDGDFTLGSTSQVSTMLVRSATTLNGFEPGVKLTLAMDLVGEGNLLLNTNGSGSEVIANRPRGLDGTLRFSGSGDTLRIAGPESFNLVEMSSTGANRVSIEPTTSTSLVNQQLTFSQPGSLVHAATAQRLQTLLNLVANAGVTVDLSASLAADERRMLIADSNGHLTGAADITVNGTVSPPLGGNITRNEFEVGGTTPEEAVTDTYSGTITANDYVNFEIRHSLPNAKVVVNSNALLDMGHQVIAATNSIRLGGVQVNNGGTLEVGFEQSSATNDGHHAYTLTLTADGSRHGDLTLADGSITRMQINGTANNQFDRILPEGDVVLDGTLNVLINPVASTGTNPTYTPAIGNTFNVITIVPAARPGDYNLNGSVGAEDYDLWRSTFGNTILAGTGADGNANGTIDAADFVIWRKNNGQASSIVGALTGAFDAITVTDVGGTFAGFSFLPHYTASGLQLEVVSSGSGMSVSATVPEPSSIACLLLTGMAAVKIRRRSIAHRG